MKLINVILYPMAVCCRVCWIVFSFDYKKFFDSATDPEVKASIIAGNFAKIVVGIALIFIVIGIINAIIN